MEGWVRRSSKTGGGYWRLICLPFFNNALVEIKTLFKNVVVLLHLLNYTELQVLIVFR